MWQVPLPPERKGGPVALAAPLRRVVVRLFLGATSGRSGAEVGAGTLVGAGHPGGPDRSAGGSGGGQGIGVNVRRVEEEPKKKGSGRR